MMDAVTPGAIEFGALADVNLYVLNCNVQRFAMTAQAINQFSCCRSERALSERARQHTNFVQLLKISILPEPQSMLVKSHFTNMQRAAMISELTKDF